MSPRGKVLFLLLMDDCFRERVASGHRNSPQVLTCGRCSRCAVLLKVFVSWVGLSRFGFELIVDGCKSFVYKSD